MTIASEVYMQPTDSDAGLSREVERSQKHAGRPFSYRPRAYKDTGSYSRKPEPQSHVPWVIMGTFLARLFL
jgi:hypothetical protein